MWYCTNGVWGDEFLSRGSLAIILIWRLRCFYIEELKCIAVEKGLNIRSLGYRHRHAVGESSPVFQVGAYLGLLDCGRGII